MRKAAVSTPREMVKVRITLLMGAFVSGAFVSGTFVLGSFVSDGFVLAGYAGIKWVTLVLHGLH